MTPGDLKLLVYYFPARWLASAIPVAWAGALGRLLAAIEYATVRPANRRRLQQNIARALGLVPGSSQVDSLSRQVVRHYVWDQLEFALAGRIEKRAAFLEMAGFEPVQEALDKGIGAVIAGGHLATFELHAAAFAWKGYQTGLIIPGETRPGRVSGFAQKRIARFRDRRRQETLAYSAIYTGGALQQAVNLLKQGGIVVLGVDYPPAQESQSCSFLGQSQPVPSGAARMAIEAGAPVFLAQLERIRFGQNRLTLTPVTMPRSDDREADILALAQTLAKGYEHYVRANPAQWAWLMWLRLGQWPQPPSPTGRP
jgi:lauroyl/myristoyl acyltransferase